MADHKGDIAPTSNNEPLHFPPEDQLEPTKTVQVLKHDAKLATDKEKNMTLLQGIKLYPKAVAWSVLISTCIVMEGGWFSFFPFSANFSHSHVQATKLVSCPTSTHFRNSTRNLASSWTMVLTRCLRLGKPVSAMVFTSEKSSA